MKSYISEMVGVPYFGKSLLKTSYGTEDIVRATLVLIPNRDLYGVRFFAE